LLIAFHDRVQAITCIHNIESSDGVVKWFQPEQDISHRAGLEALVHDNLRVSSLLFHEQNLPACMSHDYNAVLLPLTQLGQSVYTKKSSRRIFFEREALG
jgi:hypothetical protein